jgi:DNA-binding LytR/AlgR family response regulator
VTLRALIVDDEAPARSELRYLLGVHAGIEVVGEAASAGEALRLAEAVAYDVLFLDVEMPGLTGIEAARLVREGPGAPAVVFVTAHERYAVDAFAVEAFDYLLKPVDANRLGRVVERLSRRRQGRAPASIAKIPVVSAGQTVLIDHDAVHYVQADGDYSRVHTYDRSYLCTSSLRELEGALPASFVRIHRSYVVNLAKVSAVRRAGPDRLRLALADEAQTELDVARRQSRQVRERLRL